MAARSLGKIGDPKAVEPLAQALENQDWGDGGRQEAEAALEELESKKD